MSTRARISALTAALGVVVACSSSGGGGGGSSTSVDGTEPDGGSGSGPCKTGGEACQECVDAASKICNEGPCKAEDIDLQNCAVMSVYYPCEDMRGLPTDCCVLQERLLIDCWNQKCPEMQACM